MRALDRLIGPRPAYPLSPTTSPESITRVVLSGQTTAFLQRQLKVPGRLQCGLLFGHHDTETLHVLLATSAGLPWWYEGEGSVDIDPRFTLGVSEAVGALLQGYADWCGHWLIFPDGQLGPQDRTTRWYARGVAQGHFDDRHVLVVVGYDDEQLRAQVCLPSVTDEPEEHEGVFEAGRGGDTLRHVAELLSPPSS